MSGGGTGPTPSSDLLMADKLLQHHTVENLLNISSPGQQPLVADVPELLSQDKGPATLTQIQRLEPLAVLFWAQADPLEDGLLQVGEDQEVLHGQLLGRHLPPPLSSGMSRTGQCSCCQPHALADFSNKSMKASGSSCGLIQGHMSGSAYTPR